MALAAAAVFYYFPLRNLSYQCFRAAAEFWSSGAAVL